jgi:RNase P subunit RPR2
LTRSKGINMGIVYLYRAVNCKTCKAPIVVEYLGPTVDVRIAGTISNPGQLRCPGCGESHNYKGQDIKFLIKEHPPNWLA